MVVENPTFSIADATNHFNKSAKKIYVTLRKYKYHPYKILPVQQLSENQKNHREGFCRRMLELKMNDNDIFKKILWSDEASFNTAGLFNRKNSHIWASANPHGYKEIKFQGRRSVSVWCGILNDKVIGPMFYQGSLSGERYLNFLGNDIENLLENLPLRQYNELIWHQDGAPPHNVFPVRDFLNNRYPLWIGKNGGIEWPANSPDLTPLDAFLWGYLKADVYKERSRTLEDLKIRITNAINTLNQEKSHFIVNSINKLDDDYRKCINNNGGYIEHL